MSRTYKDQKQQKSEHSQRKSDPKQKDTKRKQEREFLEDYYNSY